MNTAQSFYQTPKQSANADSATTEELLSFLLPRPQAMFLDIGCWDGEKTMLMAQKIGAREIWGVDFLELRLEQARARGVQTLWADFNAETQLDLPDASFDVIVCSEVLEHVFSPDFLFDEMTRLLKPDGYILITTPNLASWKNRISLALGWQPLLTEVSARTRYGNPFNPPGRPSGHIRMFTLRAMLEMAGAFGLRPQRVGGLALVSPARTLAGALSRAGDAALTRFPALADRMIIRFGRR
jgi:2-polyprenyl-3-methyl-5-hydroxy-6-metoxy-1,4-benzoquinol methylase